MIASEVVPPILTWPQIRDHVRLAGDDEKAYCLNLGLAAVEAFEHETGVAVSPRTITVTYGPEDYSHGCRTCGIVLDVPKGPVDPTSLVLTGNGSTLPSTAYSLAKSGHTYTVRMRNFLGPTINSCGSPIVLTYTAGMSSTPALVVQACLIHVETMYRNRGATSAQSQSELAFGLERIYNNYRTFKALAG